MAKIKFDGLDQLSKDLKKLEQNAKKLNGKKIPLQELFTTAFMRKYTKYSSIDALFKAGGFIIESDADLEAIPQKELDAHIAKNTKFRSWDKMLDEAADQYITKQLGF